MESSTAERRGQCTRCGRPARLIIALAGVTGQAGYELWLCDDCGLRERIDPGALAARSRFAKPRQRRMRARGPTSPRVARAAYQKHRSEPRSLRLRRACEFHVLAFGALDHPLKKSFRIRLDHPDHRLMIRAQAFGDCPPRPFSKRFVGWETHAAGTSRFIFCS